MKNLTFNNIKINYEDLPEYNKLRKSLSQKFIQSISVILRVFWILIRQLKYDPWGFFKTIFKINDKKTVETSELKNTGYEISKISIISLLEIKKILNPLIEKHKKNSIENNVNDFDKTISILNKHDLFKLKGVLLSDDNFIKGLKSISKYKSLKKLPKVNKITLQCISASDGYAKERVLRQNEFPCEYMHRDAVIGQIKILMYLTDVKNESNGPTGFCKKSHLGGKPNLNSYVGGAVDNLGLFFRDEKTKQKFISLPKMLQIKSDFGSDIPKNSPLSNFLLSNEEKIIGDAGAIIVFDPLGIHRGGIVTDGTRETLQISIALK